MASDGASSRARVALLLNPAAGSNRRRDIAGEFSRTFGAEAQVFTTPPPGSDAGSLHAQLRALGETSTLCVAGGDGTLHLALNALLDARGESAPWPQLALLPTGSANDGARALSELLGRRLATGSEGLEALARRLREGAVARAADVGILRTGSGWRRAFANFAAAGSPADWAELSGRRWLAPLKRLSVRAAYQLCNLSVIARRRIHRVAVGLDGAPVRQHEVFAWFAANARWLGGGMDLGADVQLDSGQLAILTIERAGRRELVRVLSAAKRGAGPQVVAARHARLTLPAPARVNLDGALVALGSANAVEIGVLPGRAQWV